MRFSNSHHSVRITPNGIRQSASKKRGNGSERQTRCYDTHSQLSQDAFDSHPVYNTDFWFIKVSDQLAAGEIKLTEYTEEESQAAKARLEEKRAKRRERYIKKASN